MAKNPSETFDTRLPLLPGEADHRPRSRRRALTRRLVRPPSIDLDDTARPAARARRCRRSEIPRVGGSRKNQRRRPRAQICRGPEEGQRRPDRKTSSRFRPRLSAVRCAPRRPLPASTKQGAPVGPAPPRLSRLVTVLRTPSSILVLSRALPGAPQKKTRSFRRPPPARPRNHLAARSRHRRTCAAISDAATPAAAKDAARSRPPALAVARKWFRSPASFPPPTARPSPACAARISASSMTASSSRSPTLMPRPHPASVALVIDASPSVLRDSEEMKRAADALIDALAPLDQAAVVDFSAHTYLQLPFSDVRELIRRAVARVDVRELFADTGGSNIYEAVYLAARDLFPGRTGRKAIVLLTDGQDSGLGLTLDPASAAPRAAANPADRLTFDDVARTPRRRRHPDLRRLHRKPPESHDAGVARRRTGSRRWSRPTRARWRSLPTRSISPNWFAAPAASSISCAKRKPWPTPFAKSPNASAPNTPSAFIPRPAQPAQAHRPAGTRCASKLPTRRRRARLPPRRVLRSRHAVGRCAPSAFHYR